MSTGTGLSAEQLRTASYYDRTAEVYDSQVDGQRENRTIRTAFRTRVAMLAGPGGTILDFGCGTGTDAAWYAEHGHHVVAYDISSAMLQVLRDRCAAAIARGAIDPVAAGDFDALESMLRRSSPLDVIAANFAVLNHIEDLRPVLASLAYHLAPGAPLVASIMNPWYRGDMRRWWWWRGLFASLRTAAIVVRGDVTTYRYFLRSIVHMLPSNLTLVEMASCNESGWKSLGRANPLLTVNDQFIFIVLQRSLGPA